MKTCPHCGEKYADTNTLCPADGAVLKKAGNDLIGQTLAGKYRIDERLEEGGMGTVYRATHVLMEKTVAIKVLHPSLAADETIVARFTREAKAASRISHPHALVVTDFGEAENGIVYLVMEYLRGDTLKEVIRREGPMPLPRVVEILRQVCGALEAAHAEGVIHRDLKSDNIMLEEVAEGQDWAKVLDFGIAKIQEPVGDYDPGLTAPNLVIGTPQYMSPEQCSQSSQIDARSDIYSLGVILYEMLTGHVPFTGDSPTAIMMKHLQEPVPPLLDKRKDLPAAIGPVVARALAKQPEERYQSAGQLLEATALAAADHHTSPAATTGGYPAPVLNIGRTALPTASITAPGNTTDDEAEVTVVTEGVHPRGDEGEEARYQVAPPATASLNPWRIMVPAIVLLFVVFGVFFALQTGSEESAPEEGTPLLSDPKGEPVQAIAPPSGEGERDIAPGVVAAPNVPATNRSSNSSSSPDGSENPDANVSALPAAGEDGEEPTAGEDAAGATSTVPGEEIDEGEKPTPSPRGNTNQRPALPSIKAKPDVTPTLPQPSATPVRKTETPPVDLPTTTPPRKIEPAEVNIKP